MDASTFDALLDECAWLRRLARHLVGDPHDAEDVAQETWLAAAHAGGLPSRGWMRVVARRTASRSRRGERRRSDRERLIAADEGGTPSGEDLVERLELARRVALELQGLPEPYRNTLYLRYYEGLEATVIAQREGIPAGTVRWRAQRGRELLRDALTRDGSTWEQWAALLAPIAGGPAAPAAAAALPWLGGIAMSVKWTLAGALAGALAAGGTWIAREPVSVPPQAGPPAGADVHAGSDPGPATTRPADDAPSAGQRTVAVPVTGAPDEEFGVIGLGRVTDETGAPVLGALPVFEDGEARLATATGGPSGGWSLAGLAPGVHSLTLEVDGYVPHRERVEVPAGRSWRRDVTLQRGRHIPVRFEDPSGEALAVRRFGDGLRGFLSVVATAERPGSRLVGVRGRLASRYGVGSFDSRAERETAADLDLRYQGVLHLNATPPVWVSLVCRDTVLETRSLSGMEEELAFVIDEDELQGIHGEVRVRLVDHRGAAVLDGARLQHPSGGISVRGEAEGDQIVFRDVPPGQLDLMLERGSREHEHLERSVLVPARQSVDLGTIHLGPRVPFRVRMVDPAGAPLTLSIQAVRPELVAGVHDLDLRVGLRADAEGWTEVSHLGPGSTLLRAGGRDGHARVAREVDTSRESSFELVVPPGTEVVLAGPRRSGETFVLEGPQGLPLYSGFWVPRVAYVSPGAYTLVRSFDGVQVDRRPFWVGAERTVVRWGAW